MSQLRWRCFSISGICLAITMLLACTDGGDKSLCGDPVPNCIVADGAGQGGMASCYDVAKPPLCWNGVWNCPTGTVPQEQCACHFRADAAEYCPDGAQPQ